MTLPALAAEARRILASGLPGHFTAVQFARLVVAVAEFMDDEWAIDKIIGAGLSTYDNFKAALTADLERRMAEMERVEMARAETEEGS